MTANRNPDTIFLLGLLFAAGVGQLVSGAESGSVEALVPGWVLIGWSVTLTAGAGITLAGLLWPRPITGLEVETVGRAMLGPSSLAYAFAVINAGGGSGALVAAILLGLAVSSVWRIHQIRRQLLNLHDAIAAMADTQEGDL